jgi:structural maintenance of chromosome 4
MSTIEAAAKADAEEWGDLDADEDDNSEVAGEDTEMETEDGGVEEMKEDTEDGIRTPDETENTKLNDILPLYSEDVLSRHDRETVKERIAVLETERNSIAKNANLGAIAEYRKKEIEYLSRYVYLVGCVTESHSRCRTGTHCLISPFSVAELDAITEERNGHRRNYEDLRRKRLEMFMEGFGQITLKLKEMYQMITLGGDAELELVDSLDPFSEGIVFSVRPPKKSWKNISNLSGGEKTLSSLALVFALHHYKPTPLYVMDEIDAALDFKNVSIVANYIKERTRNAQFVIISLRNNMFELADRLVGIYKTDNCTKSVTINPRAFGIEARQNGLLATTPALLNRTNKSISSAVKESARRRLSIHSESSVQENSE